MASINPGTSERPVALAPRSMSVLEESMKILSNLIISPKQIVSSLIYSRIIPSIKDVIVNRFICGTLYGFINMGNLSIASEYFSKNAIILIGPTRRSKSRIDWNDGVIARRGCQDDIWSKLVNGAILMTRNGSIIYSRNGYAYIIGRNFEKDMDCILSTYNKNAINIRRNAYNTIRFNDIYGAPDICSVARPQSSIFTDSMAEVNLGMMNLLKRIDMAKTHGLGSNTSVLLYGKPGTGKSTILNNMVMNIRSHHFKRNSNIYLYKLRSPRSEGDSNVMMNTIVRLDDIIMGDDMFGTTILVIEDCDLYMSARGLEDNNSINLTEYLMGIMDTRLSATNLLVFMTTNHIDKLDPALLRPGRMSLKLEIGDIGHSKASEMCDHYKVSLGDLQEKFPELNEAFINPAFLEQCIMSELDKCVN